MRPFRVLTLFLALAIIFSVQSSVRAAEAPKTMVQKNCLGCHQSFSKMEDVLAGNLSSKSMKAKTMQVKINNLLELIKFTPETKVKNIPDMKALSGSVAMRVHYKTVGNDRVATEVVVKPKIKVPEEQLLNVDELAKLVAQGPDKGNYILIDSRPPAGYNKGHIPSAISIPFPKMKEMMGTLPKDKDRLLIFYCQGYR